MLIYLIYMVVERVVFIFDGCGTESRAEPLNCEPCQRMGYAFDHDEIVYTRSCPGESRLRD